MLDPDGDGYITSTGNAFSSPHNEAAEFELPSYAVSNWREIVDVNEAGSDVNPPCSNIDIVGGSTGGGIAFWVISDPTPGLPSSGDEYIVLRMRIADNFSGNYGYNFLISNDGLYGEGSDPNAVTGNQGFEYEIQFSSGGAKQGVSGWEVDGSVQQGSITCQQCVALEDVQQAVAASAAGCSSGTPTFITFGFPLSYLGIASNVYPANLFIGLATASSGNNTSILGGGNIKDFGGIDVAAAPPTCSSLQDAELFDCILEESYTAQQSVLPVELISFSGIAQRGVNTLEWTVAKEEDLSHYSVEYSVDGMNFNLADRILPTPASTSNKFYAVKHFTTEPILYYRLRSSDFDGSVQVSELIIVSQNRISADLHCFPNPASSFVNLTGLKHGGGLYTFKLQSAMGESVLSGQLAEGQRRVELSDVPKGSYLLSLSNPTLGEAVTLRLVKQ